VNFPLSTYSVFGEKNVSQENENTFGDPGSHALSADQDKRHALRSYCIPFYEFRLIENCMNRTFGM
jgi:hypothetical protein